MRVKASKSIGLVVLAVGLLLVVATYLPMMNPEQCPANVVEPGCIVGANIGAALARLAGLLIAGIGALVFLVLASRGFRD